MEIMTRRKHFPSNIREFETQINEPEEAKEDTNYN